ncbi:hypothetical protein [Phenylobacterium sp.]|uniref:hypothetical protein n=1 Tax=Phenylobacterium sp. TaxID=1871053 RepID=UPI002DEC9712|nr:hypothetical protein [Phenylobacterium sp.]
MLTAVLAAASILGAHPLSATDSARQALVVQSGGRTVMRLDATGFVQARGCNGALMHVGDLTGPKGRIHIENDGALTGLTWDVNLTPDQRASFRLMMRALGMSDHRALGDACLPTGQSGSDVVDAFRDETAGP